MFQFFSKLKQRFILHRHPIAPALWERVIQQLPICRSLSAAQREKLNTLCTVFLYEKTFTGVKGFELDDEKRLIISIQACLPILNLDLSYYDGWVEIVVYPDTFVIYRHTTDDLGLVSSSTVAATGEAWSRGPVILAWTDVARDSFQPRPGHNVVIHEFSHKLDMLNGRANGMPPLHPTMRRSDWTESLSSAYVALHDRIQNRETTAINEYAATNPAEFFAVLSETFFTAPYILKEKKPDVYDQLALFYKQQPAVVL